MKAILILLFSLFATSAHALMLAQTDNKQIEKSVNNCSITIQFGSYGMGTDWKLEKEIKTILENNKNIKALRHENWGLEGESTTCIIVDPSYKETLYQQLRAKIPAYSKKAWTSIQMDGKPLYQTQWPKK